MKTIEYRTIDKSTWGLGPWQNEPDKKQWQDATTGLPCLAVRNESGGNWCGYVGVGESHPWFGKDYNTPDVEVHGGLTFSDSCMETEDEAKLVCHKPDEAEPDNMWWLGFDCHHAFDLAPAYHARYPQFPALPGECYRDLAYIEAECANLARQIAEAKP